MCVCAWMDGKGEEGVCVYVRVPVEAQQLLVCGQLAVLPARRNLVNTNDLVRFLCVLVWIG